jgi:hypothetical protein
MRGGSVRRGIATTSQTRGAGGYGIERGMTRGNGTMRGKVTSRWEAAARGEAMQQPAGQEAREAIAPGEAVAR